MLTPHLHHQKLRFVLAILLTLSFYQASKAQMPKVVTKLSAITEPERLITTYDSGFIISSFYNNNSAEIYKVDLNGNKLWGRAFGGGFSRISKIEELPDGNIAIAGGAGNTEPFFCILSSCGNLIQNVVFKNLFDQGIAYIYDFHKINDNEYILMFQNSVFNIDPSMPSEFYSLFAIYNINSKQLRNQIFSL